MDHIKFAITSIPKQFNDAKSVLVERIKTITGPDHITKFCIGKSYTCSHGQRTFSITDHQTWSLEGLNSRWHNKYKKEDYNEVVAVTAISRETLPDYIPVCQCEQYALSMEQELINHFMWVEPDSRLANKTTDPGKKVEEPKEAFVIYVATKTKHPELIELRTAEPKKSNGQDHLYTVPIRNTAGSKHANQLNLAESVFKTEIPFNVHEVANMYILEFQLIKALVIHITQARINREYSTICKKLKEQITSQFLHCLPVLRISQNTYTSIDNTSQSLVELAASISTLNPEMTNEWMIMSLEDILMLYVAAQVSAAHTIVQLQGSQAFCKCYEAHNEAQRVVNESLRLQMTRMDSTKYEQLTTELAHNHIKCFLNIADSLLKNCHRNIFFVSFCEQF